MAWSIWQSLKAREKAKTVRPDQVPAPPSLKLLLEIFGPPASPPPKEETPVPERPQTLRKEA